MLFGVWLRRRNNSKLHERSDTGYFVELGGRMDNGTTMGSRGHLGNYVPGYTAAFAAPSLANDFVAI